MLIAGFFKGGRKAGWVGNQGRPVQCPAAFLGGGGPLVGGPVGRPQLICLRQPSATSAVFLIRVASHNLVL